MNNTSYFCIPLRLCAPIFQKISASNTSHFVFLCDFASSLRFTSLRAYYSENLCEQDLKFCIPLRLCVFARHSQKASSRAKPAFLSVFDANLFKPKEHYSKFCIPLRLCVFARHSQKASSRAKPAFLSALAPIKALRAPSHSNSFFTTYPASFST